MKGKTCNMVVKKIRSPSPVKFRVWGVSTDKPFLLNGEREITVVPSDYEQDATDVSIRLVKPGGEFDSVIYWKSRMVESTRLNTVRMQINAS